MQTGLQVTHSQTTIRSAARLHRGAFVVHRNSIRTRTDTVITRIYITLHFYKNL